MIDSLSIISGKGGSGKTSLAILLSQLLASCGHKVLLIDCDMSTHGATYFFENLFKQKECYYTISNILYGNTNIQQIDLEILKISFDIGFIPSRLDFSSKKKPGDVINQEKWLSFIKEIEKQNYDIMIFDCQAGYSVETEMATKFSKVNLAVIEADAISASALRVLYAQLSKQLDKGKTYQVFNKITKEEQEIYSKLTHGTLFTNLNPILFDWNVRKAFVTNELPEINASNPILTTNIYELALVLFPQYKDKLREFILGIKQEIISSLNEKLKLIKTSTKIKSFKKMINTLSPLILAMISIFFVFFTSTINIREGISFFLKGDNYIIILSAICLGVFSSLIIILIKKEGDNDYQKQMLEIKKEQKQLEEEISRIKSKLNQQ